MGEQAETSPRQNIQAHTASSLRQTDRPTPCTPDSSLHPNLLTWFSPPPSHLTSLFLSFSLSDSPGTVKSSELSVGMSDDCVEQSTKHTHILHTRCHTHISWHSFSYYSDTCDTQPWTGSHCSVNHHKPYFVIVLLTLSRITLYGSKVAHMERV